MTLDLDFVNINLQLIGFFGALHFQFKIADKDIVMNEFDLLNVRHNSFASARQEMNSLLEERLKDYSLPQALYNDPHMFRIDMEEIFHKEWIFVGISSEIPDKGDYLTVEIGQNPVLIVRNNDGDIQAFHNVCRHRGSKICSKEKGKGANLVCPYHQWTYDTKGTLLYAGTEMGDDFDKSLHGLKEVHCRHAGGFIFICLSKGDAPDNTAFLATLDEYMSPYDMTNTKVAVQSDIIEEANWKLVIENNRECYHCSGSHPELLNTLLEWDDTDDPRASPEFLAQYERQAKEWDAEGIPHRLVTHGLQNRIVRMPLREGAQVMTMDGSAGCNKLMGRIKNRTLGSMRILHLPNSWNHMQSDHAVVFCVLPISAQKTRVITKWLVHKDAVEGVDYDPKKLRVVWDATNDQDRRLAEDNQRGINSIGYQPGPYSKTFEFGVINFIDWYSDKVLENIKSS